LTKPSGAYTFPSEEFRQPSAWFKLPGRTPDSLGHFKKNDREKLQMKRLIALCAVAVMVLSVSACNQSPDTHDADVASIKANETQWVQDYAAKDSDKVASHYADDAVLMIPGMPALSGKDAIHSAMKTMLSDPALSLKFQAAQINVAKSGDLAYSQGSYTMAMTNPQTKQVVNDHGSYVTTYRKQADGRWKAVADISASEMPPPTAATH
jgi:uncharacterized protein (TIGR02246 family)